jgi:hypothetical protein
MRDAGVGMRDEDVSMSAGEVSIDDADRLYEKMLGLAIATEKEASDALKINDRHTLSTDPLRDIKHCAGDRRLEAIRFTLNNLGYTRSQFQKLFHTHFIQACLPIIYGDDWATHAERVMKEFGLERISPEVLVQTPRRFGKTVSVAMFVLAMLLNVPGIRICIFSTGKRASGGLMLEIMDRLREIPDGNSRILKQNQEQLFISTVPRGEGVKANSETAKKQINDSNVSRLYCFPASVAGKLTHTFRHPELRRRHVCHVCACVQEVSYQKKHTGRQREREGGGRVL